MINLTKSPISMDFLVTLLFLLPTHSKSSYKVMLKAKWKAGLIALTHLINFRPRTHYHHTHFLSG